MTMQISPSSELECMDSAFSYQQNDPRS